MNWEQLDATPVYLLSALLGGSAGVALGSGGTRFSKWVLTASGLVTMGVFFVVAREIGNRAIWMGPVFGIALALTVVLVSAQSERDHPLLRAEPYWRRLVLVVFHQRALRSTDRERPHVPPKTEA